jgi:hypothetical protein
VLIAKAGLAQAIVVCYSLAPPTQNLSLRQRSEGKKGVDEIVVKLHTLSSLLLTNTTLRNKAASATPNKFFKN